MRIKFLAIIAGFIFVSIAISSCLDSDDNTIELSSDATVHAFGIDTIYGKSYKFTIDQLNREIYNQDSLPMGADTILDRILIDTFTVSGWITSGIGDTIFVQTDSVDLTGAINKAQGEGMKFKVHAPDGTTNREYSLTIRVHKQDPDSLVWDKMETALPAPIASGEQAKAILFNGDLWVFTSSKAYRTPTRGGAYWMNTGETYGWEEEPYDLQSPLPSNAKLESLVCFKYNEGDDVKQTLYLVTTDYKVYASEDGLAWNEETRWNGISNIQTLIASFTNTLTIVADGNKVYTANYNGNEWTTSTETVIEEAGFPISNIYSTYFENNYQPQVMIVGANTDSDSQQTVPWASSDGWKWYSLKNTSSYEVYCPKMNNPALMYYGENFYIFGSVENNKLDAIYSSVNGISWRKTEKKFLLDKAMNIAASYSIVADSPYIWVIFGGDGSTNEVWRGHLNKLMPPVQSVQ